MPHKICPGCKKGVGVRTRECDCGYKFLAKIKPKNNPKLDECDWRSLKPGDRIKTVQGTGPVYMLNGQVEYMGHFGIFTVHSLNKDGINVFGDEGYAYIYMGKERKMITGTILRPYKIKMIRKER